MKEMSDSGKGESRSGFLKEVSLSWVLMDGYDKLQNGAGFTEEKKFHLQMHGDLK